MSPWRALAVTLAVSAHLYGQALPLPAVVPAPTPPPLYLAQEAAFQAAMARVAPGVVTIETIGGVQPAGEKTGAAPGEPGAPGFIVAEGPTTGLVWSSNGLIVTSSFNFVRDPSLITVTLSDGRRFVGELLARDEVRRLAMVKIDATDLPAPKWVTESDGLRVGQWAIALGRGFGPVLADPKAERPGRDPSMAVGIVSALDRMSGLALQTDARLSPANFGGPLVDVEGRVLGVCVPMGLGRDELAGIEWYDSGIGFAVPHEQVRKSAESLAVGHSLRRGLLGVVVDRTAKDTVRVSAVADPSPAARSGIQSGDVILAIDAEPVQTSADLTRVMRPRSAGQWVKVRIRRDDKEIELEVILAVPEDLGKVSQDD